MGPGAASHLLLWGREAGAEALRAGLTSHRWTSWVRQSRYPSRPDRVLASGCLRRVMSRAAASVSPWVRFTSRAGELLRVLPGGPMDLEPFLIHTSLSSGGVGAASRGCPPGLQKARHLPRAGSQCPLAWAHLVRPRVCPSGPCPPCRSPGRLPGSSCAQGCGEQAVYAGRGQRLPSVAPEGTAGCPGVWTECMHQSPLCVASLPHL